MRALPQLLAAVTLGEDRQWLDRALDWTHIVYVDTVEALRAALNRSAWDVLIADDALPGLTPEDVKAAPVILITDAESEEAAQRAAELGTRDYVRRGDAGRLAFAIRRELDIQIQFTSRRRLLDALPLPVFFKDADGRYLGCNTAFARFLGRPKEEIIGSTVYDIAPAHLADTYDKMDQALLSSPGTQRYEALAQDGEGRLRNVVFYKASLSDSIIGVMLDITKQKQAERARHESEERFRALAQSSLDALITTNMHGQILFVNHAAESMFGYTTDEIQRHNIIDLMPEDYRKRQERAMARFRETGQHKLANQIVAFEGLHKSGHRFPIEMAIYAWEAGGETYFGAAIRDITARKHTEEALRTTRRELERILQTMVDGMVVVNLKGQIIYANHAAERILEIRKDEILGRYYSESSWQQVDTEGTPYPPDQLPLTIALREQREVRNQEHGYASKARGKTKWLSVNAAPLFDEKGQMYGAVASFRDITEQKRAEEALRESEERVRAFIEGAEDMVYFQGLDGSLSMLNEANARITGYSLEEFAADPYLWERIVHPEDMKVAEQFFAEHPKGTPSFEVTYRLRTKSGQWRWIQSRMVGVRDESGQYIGYNCIDRDITDLKRAQAELEKHRDRLEELVAERTCELERALAVKDRFVSNVSHELRTPITSIKLYLDLLPRRADKLPIYMDRLRRETERLEYIVEDVLLLSRMDQDRIEMEPVPVDINALAGDYVSDREMLAQRRQIHLTFDAWPDLPPVHADPRLLTQVLGNLLTNAINYTPAGGEVCVSTRIQHEPNGAQWVGFVVSDTGPGIPPDQHSHVFKRFFRGEAGRESGAPGTGLGLSIAREIVERHQGHMEIHSEGVPGKGTTFYVWLPSA